MDQMAENTPEVEIETDASEQIPDDVELAEKVETEDGSEPPRVSWRVFYL